MNGTFRMAISVVFLLGSVAATNAAVAEHEEHHPGTEQGAASGAAQPAAAGQPMSGMMEMMGQGMMDMMKQKGMMETRPCMEPTAPSARLHMMGGALSGRMAMDPGMMRHMMDREFFLDRVDELGLSAEQVEKLRAIRGACRKENIRTGAEARIVRLELDDLLSRDDWTPEDAEKLVRQQQKLEGDMVVRHLKALDEARQVLTADQLKEAGSRGASLEDLF